MVRRESECETPPSHPHLKLKMNYAYRTSIDLLHAAQAAAFLQNPTDAVRLARQAAAVCESADVTAAPGWYAYLLATQYYLEGDLSKLFGVLPRIVINADVVARLAIGLLMHGDVNYARDFVRDTGSAPLQLLGLAQLASLAPATTIVRLDCIQKIPSRLLL